MLIELLNNFKDTQQSLLDVFVASIQIFPLDIANKIILKSLSENDVKDFIGEKIMRLIDKYPDYIWSWVDLSQNSNITPEFMEKHPHRLINGVETKNQWDWTAMSENPNLTMNFIEKYLKNKPWSGSAISRHPNISMDDIKKHPKLTWDWNAVSRNPNLTVDFIENSSSTRWNMNAVSCNPNITLKDIESHPQITMHKFKKALSWDWTGISSNPNLTIDFVKRHLDKNWCWEFISQNSNINMNDIETNIDLPWVWHYIARNPNLTIAFIKKYFDRFDDQRIWFDDQQMWEDISCNPNITMEDIEQYPEGYWIYKYISRNPNLTQAFVEKHPYGNIDSVANGIPWSWCRDRMYPAPLRSRHAGKLFGTVYVPPASKLTMEFMENNMELRFQYIEVSKYIGTAEFTQLTKEIENYFV